MIASRLLPIALTALLSRAIAAAACDELAPEVCARTCVPFHYGTDKQVDFSCGDWWLRARCCNGTEPNTLVTSVYYNCTCQADGMTARGLAVILVLGFAAISVIFAAVAYVLYRCVLQRHATNKSKPTVTHTTDWRNAVFADKTNGPRRKRKNAAGPSKRPRSTFRDDGCPLHSPR